MWGDENVVAADGVSDGFGGEEDGFDSFLSMGPPPVIERNDSHDSDDETKEFNVVIKPIEGMTPFGLGTPILAPPPPRSSQNNSIYSGGESPITLHLYYRNNPKSYSKFNIHSINRIARPHSLNRLFAPIQSLRQR